MHNDSKGLMREIFIVLMVMVTLLVCTAKVMTSSKAQKGLMESSRIMVKPFIKSQL